MTVKNISEDDIFNIARRIDCADLRNVFLRQVCGTDTGLAKRVAALIGADIDDEFLENCPVAVVSDTKDLDSGADTNTKSEGFRGESIGPYILREKIGEGGFGVVYVAEQKEPVARKVALKVIKPGMDSKDIIARFEAERQALAMMDHPNVAKVFDAGATESGRPYFVMELVHGIAITEYCDSQKLTNRQRLELFIDVCQAVQHAHQKGIIHRDIKPSNVMVTMADDKPIVKVIDFGVAKALHHDLTDKSIYTAYGQLVGTPMYMSPEQAQLSCLDVDTRSDIYSLGVLLYVLLTGTTPFDKETFKKVGFDEMRRMIREVEPRRPSEQVSTFKAEQISTISDSRKIDQRSLSRALRGDLDWIVMKALEKDRTRRYETATSLVEDVQRFLDEEPVAACPPSTVYRFRKFARRNKAAMVISSLLGLGVFLGVAVLSVSNHMIAQREADKQVALQQASYNLQLARQHQKKAEENFLDARMVIDFVKNDIFGVSSIQEESRFDEYATLAELLDRAGQNLDDRTGLEPRIKAELCLIIGLNFQALDDLSRAIGFLRKSVELYRMVHGNLQEEIRAENALANGLSLAHQDDEALLLQKQSLEICRRELGEDHPLTLESMQNLAVIHRRLFQLAEAIPLLEKVLEIRKTKLGEDHIDTLKTMSNLAWAYVRAGQVDTARDVLERTIARQTAVLGVEHRDTLDSMNKLSWLYVDMRDYDKVVALREQILEVRKAKLGNDHRETLKSMESLANGYVHAGLLESAINLLQQTLELQTEKLGDEHPDTLNTLSELASLKGSEIPPEELPIMIQQWEIAKSRLGEDHPETLEKMISLADHFLAHEQFEKGLAMYQQILHVTKSREGKDHWMTLDAMHKLSWAYRIAGQFDKSIPLIEQIVELSRHDFPLTRSDYSYIQGWKHKSLCELGWAYHDAGRIHKAILVFEQVLEMRTTLLGEDHPDTLDCMRMLGTAYAIAGQIDESLKLLERTVAKQTIILGESHSETLQSMGHLGEAYRIAKQFDKAIEVLRRAIQLQTRRVGEDHPDTLYLLRYLAAAYRSAGRADKAVPILQQMVAKTQARSGEDHFNSICHANTLASTYLQIDRLAEAEQILRKSHGHSLRTMPNHWVTFNTMSLLGEALMRQHEYASAEPLLLDGYHGLVKRKNLIPPFFRLTERGGTSWIGIDVSNSKTRVAEAIERLIQLYEAWNEKQPDAGFDSKAAQWRQKLNEENSIVVLIDP